MLTQKQQDLVRVGNELSRIADKRSLSPSDHARIGFLKMADTMIRTEGLTLDELETGDVRSRAAAVGVEVPQRAVSYDRETEARAWKAFFEQRDMTEGAPMLSHIGTYTSLGYFIPTGFFPTLFAALGQHDALFNEADVTLIKTSNGRPIALPTVGDIENVASVVGEGSQSTSTDLSAPGTAKLGAYKYQTWDAVSIEAFDDIEGALSTVSVFQQNFAVRFARGIGKDLVTGSGSGKTLGLIPSLQAAGVPVVTAAGSASNDGSSNTGVNSLGSNDFMNALSLLDDAYANSPKCAWFMSKKTLAALSGQLDKYGNIVRLVEYCEGVPTIFGIPVKICPSMASVGSTNIPVVLMDGSYWATRLATDEESGIQVFKEAVGLAEYGKVGLRAYMRADGELLYNDSSSPAPAVIIQCHS